MDTYNNFLAWVSWRFFLFGNVLSRLFRFSSIAKREVHSVDTAPAEGTGYERQKSRAFYDHLTRIDSDAFTRNDVFLLLLIAACIYFFANYVALIEISDRDYLYYAAWAALVIGLTGLIWAAFVRKPRVWPESEEEYRNHNDLLRTVGMTARRPIGFPGRVVIFLMLLVDAAMISIVALDYAADLPRNFQLMGGVAVGVVFALCLVWLTHHTGEQLFRGVHHNKLVSIIRDERMQSADKETSALHDNLRKHSITFLVQEKGFFSRYLWLLITFVFILAIVSAATYARYNQNENLLLEQLRGPVFGEWTPGNTGASRFGAQHGANMDTLRDQQYEAQENAMIAGITILAIVFIAIQIVAITMAFKHAFALDGEEDLHAYQRILQYRTQVLATEDGDFKLTRSQKMVINRASRFFAAYFYALKKQAHKNGRATFSNSLDNRGPYDFEHFAVGQLAKGPEGVHS